MDSVYGDVEIMGMWKLWGCGNYGDVDEIMRLQVSFPKDETTQIATMRNDAESLIKRAGIWVCVTHFEGEWMTILGCWRPVSLKVMHKASNVTE